MTHQPHNKIGSAGLLAVFEARPGLALALTVAACLGFFLAKPFHIDDPLFIWAAQKIHSNPFDPYGFAVNWYRYEMPMWEVTKNPPLACYYIALAAALLGWSELALHTAFLLPAIAVVVGTYRLAQRMCDHALLAGLATLFTPVFLVSSSTVMCDTLMLAFWVWAVVLWERGLEEQGLRGLVGAGILIALAALTKYFGACLIPLLLVHGFLRKRQLGMWALPLLVPVAAMIAYQIITTKLYGRGLLTDAWDYATEVAGGTRPPLLPSLVKGVQFTGGCIAWGLFLAPFLWRRAHLILMGVAALACGMLLYSTFGYDLHEPFEHSSGKWVGVQAAFWTLGGLTLLALAVADVRQRRTPESWLLFCWVMGTFVFASLLNWTINARSVLPLAPAAAILLARRLDWLAPTRPQAWLLKVKLAFIPAAALAMIVTWADATTAGAIRDTADEVAARHANDPVKPLFVGHWGFQYYLEQYRFECWDQERTKLKVGDRLIVPDNNTNAPKPPAGVARVAEKFTVRGARWVATMRLGVGGGFHAATEAPLAFGFGNVPSEQVTVYEFHSASP